MSGRVDMALAAELVERRSQLRLLLGSSYEANVSGLRPLIAARLEAGGHVNALQAAIRMVEELVAEPPPGLDIAVAVSLLLVTGAFEMEASQ